VVQLIDIIQIGNDCRCGTRLKKGAFMNAIGKNFLWILFMVGIMSPLYSAQEGKKTEAILKRVDKEMSILDEIIEKVDIIVDSSDESGRIQAKKQLKHLMDNKDLDETIKNAIRNDIEIIKKFKTKTKKELHEARQRLFIIDDQINSQANVIDAIAQATKMIENASPEELDQVIAQAKEKIEQAETEKQGFFGRAYAKAKRIITAPVNYVFGEESSRAKTIFYTAVGLAIAAAAGYYAHQSYSSGRIGPISEEEDSRLSFLDKEIESLSKSSSYSGAVAMKSRYQIEKYIRQREEALNQEPNNKDAAARLHALKEFHYFFLYKHWAPGEYAAAILLRNPENLSSNSPYLEQLGDIMWTHGSRTSLRVDDRNNVIGAIGMSHDEAKADYDEFMKTLHQYNKFILEDESDLSRKVNIPVDELYKMDYKSEYINELEKSVQKPTWWQRLFGK